MDLYVYEGYNKNDYGTFVRIYNKEGNVLKYDYKSKMVMSEAKDHLAVIDLVNINALDKLLNEMDKCDKVESNIDEYISNIGPIKAIKIFQKETKLIEQDFVYKVEILNALEELLETLEMYETEDGRVVAEEIYDKYFKGKKVASPDKLIDGFTDLRVIGIGATMKLGYDPNCTLSEVAKHINSRRGDIIDGKFVKSKKEEDVKLWYQPDFNSCKR